MATRKQNTRTNVCVTWDGEGSWKDNFLKNWKRYGKLSCFADVIDAWRGFDKWKTFKADIEREESRRRVSHQSWMIVLRVLWVDIKLKIL